MLQHWFQAARPKTLGAAVAPVFVGSLVGTRFGGVEMNWLLLLCTLGSTIALQVATNWFNDALDSQKGADTAARLGPQRITASGLVSGRRVMFAGALMLLVATALALPLILERGWPIIAIGLPSLYFCYGYTGGPVPLAYRGLGELFVILFFGFVAVTGSAYVQCGQWLPQALLAGLQIGCLSTVLIAINNLRDEPEDRTTGKRTLAVRFGERFARKEVCVLLLLPYLLNLVWHHYGLFILPLFFPYPLAMHLCKQAWTQSGPDLNKVLAISGGHLLVFSFLLCKALWK